MNAHMEVVVLAEERTKGIIVSMTGGGLEAVVLAEEEEVEAPVAGVGGLGVQSGKVALKEEPRLSNGIGKGNKQNLIISTTMTTMKMTEMVSHWT